MNTSQLSIKQPTINLSPDTLLYATEIYKSFTLHNQGGINLPVLEDVSLEGVRSKIVGNSNQAIAYKMRTKKVNRLP